MHIDCVCASSRILKPREHGYWLMAARLAVTSLIINCEVSVQSGTLTEDGFS
jgi:hypothetical protein